MIGSLEGRVLRLVGDRCWIQVGGVGYIVCVGPSLAAGLCVGQQIFLWIATTVHDGQTACFGFQTAEQEKWFYQLIAISGVGGKVAMSMLSVLPPEKLAQTIAHKDTLALRAIEGIGPKLAARLITELHDFAQKWWIEYPHHTLSVSQKSDLSRDTIHSADVHGTDVHGADLHGTDASTTGASFYRDTSCARLDAVQALVSLGYRRAEAEQALLRVATQYRTQEQATDQDLEAWSAKQWVTLCLPWLSPGVAR